MRIRNVSDRRGAVAVEFAFVLPVLVIILVGLWETGRLIQIKQLLSNAAREGGRVAAQGLTINPQGDPTEIRVSTGSVNVKKTVFNYLRQAGLDIELNDLQVSFEYMDGDTSLSEPFQAAKGQKFKVTVTLELEKLKWTTLGPFDPPTMTASAVWTSMVDDPFTLDHTMPNW